MDIEVKENENLYRAVKRSNPDYIIGKNKVSSAMFKDESGVSVSRDGGRSEKEVISSFKDSPFWSKRLKAIGRITNKDCQDVNVYVIEDPSQNDKYHSLIFGDKNKNNITNIQALRLSDKCAIVYCDMDMSYT